MDRNFAKWANSCGIGRMHQACDYASIALPADDGPRIHGARKDTPNERQSSVSMGSADRATL
jgi:hypothetical protein